MLPLKIINWFSNRGISTKTLDDFLISWNGNEIVIPIRDSNNKIIFNKYRRDPEKNNGPKYRYDKGGTCSIFNLADIESNIIICCEGELEAVLLHSIGYSAISSTGGSQSFLKEWYELFQGKKVYICFDNDDAGITGALKIFINKPNDIDLSVVQFPAYWTHGKDITDYLSNHTKEDFQKLIDNAVCPILPIDDDIKTINHCIDSAVEIRRNLKSKDLSIQFIEKYIQHLVNKKQSLKIKKEKRKIDETVHSVKDISIERFIEFNPAGFARCILHDERTPSMIYNRDGNWVHCFGCGKSGDVITVIRKLHKLSFTEALDFLNKNL